jgi:hypothetical protein
MISKVSLWDQARRCLLIYKDKHFKGTGIAFAPGQRIPDLSQLNMSNHIESMKITCGK